MHLVWVQEAAGSNPVIQTCRSLRRSCARVIPKHGRKSEHEGVLTMFEYFQLIVFQLVERIAFIKKPLKQAYRTDMLGFAYPALRTRHEVHGKPYLQEE